MAGSTSLKEYLKRYESKNEDDENKKKKKKKGVKTNVPLGVVVVDEDPDWKKPVKLDDDEEHNDSADEENPVVDEDIEVKRMKRLEQLKARRAYNAIAEDGSGWVSLSAKCANSAVPDCETLSPPRRPRMRNDTPSSEPERKPLVEDADLSPPRQRPKRPHTPSPESDTNASRSINPDSDLSPPRKGRARSITDPGSDLSPPRKRRARNDTPSPEPTLRSSRDDTNLSPPRKPGRQQHASVTEPNFRPKGGIERDSDMSPPRRHRSQTSEDHGRRKLGTQDVARASPEADLSPPRKSKKEAGKSAILSPQRSRRHSPENGSPYVPLDQDMSPPRKSRNVPAGPSSSRERPKTGLISGRDIREEITNIKKDDLLRYEQMDPSMSGRGAEPVYRDKKGQRISKEEYLKSKEKVKEKPKEKTLEWGKGLAQKREAEARLLELEHEKDKPFARTRDDPELDKLLKDRVRWGDPMAHLVKKKHQEPVLADLGEDERMKQSGFVIPQEIPSHSWLIRGLDAAPNRYGIRPGRHWDGVDRSNGYEKGLFKRMNEKQATEREAYLWSVSDM